MIVKNANVITLISKTLHVGKISAMFNSSHICKYVVTRVKYNDTSQVKSIYINTLFAIQGHMTNSIYGSHIAFDSSARKFIVKVYKHIKQIIFL